MLRCRDPEKIGFFKYSCPEHPDQFTIKPLSCKSRFCNVCGVLQSNIWMRKALEILPNTRFHHITFTVPDYLWYFFKLNPNLIKYLFKSSAETLLSWFKERILIPAICSGLHTFGKDLKHNTHIHMILSAGGLFLTRKGKYFWKPVSFIPYNMLRKRLKSKLINYLKPYLDEELKKLLYTLVWYTYVRNDIIDIKASAQYIGRYAKKPPLAETRITAYDGQFVTFFFMNGINPHLLPSFCPSIYRKTYSTYSSSLLSGCSLLWPFS
ncbi:MAG: transposase [Candidatus Omnitrophica bacterium]|nr:transposase [Candidatus Omnitrophota bacterium]